MHLKNEKIKLFYIKERKKDSTAPYSNHKPASSNHKFSVSALIHKSTSGNPLFLFQWCIFSGRTTIFGSIHLMILGLTGAIGCGKSTACNYFVKRGWRLFDADRCCHDLYADTDGIFCRKIRETWGDECFGSDGKIDRKALAQKVFASEKELGKLTSMLYPELFGQMESEIRKAKEAGENLLCEVPLLFECATEKYFDRTAVVWCNREIRHKRLCLFRNFTPAEIAAREAKQWSAEKKLEAADTAFINNGGAEFLYRQIDEFIKEFTI